MAHLATPTDVALDELVTLASERHDSWIPIDGALRQLINRGATTVDVCAAIGSNRLAITTRGAWPTTARPASAGVTVIDVTSPHYPSRLKHIDNAPLLLFIAGQLPTSTNAALAMVGSRKATTNGRSAAHAVAAHVARAGHPVVSGLAEGIDTASHEGALSVGGDTIAVIGTGIDRTFPVQNAALAARIATTGAVVSQFAPGQGPSKTTFPARNAVIAGLSNASLLVELDEHSGTRIEAERTIEQGKPVWLWGPIMRSEQWARRYVEHPQVDFVDDVEELLQRLRNLPTHVR
jgi:DNA processing protein